jgi:hypothetical protein
MNVVYLIDTNIWLERLLDQEKAKEVARFLSMVDSLDLCLTDFTFHSIGIALFRLDKSDLWVSFLQDVMLNGGVHLLHLEASDAPLVIDGSRKYGLDFDDAYQWAAAEKNDLNVISFDSDFDRTPRSRMTPSQALRGRKA